MYRFILSFIFVAVTIQVLNAQTQVKWSPEIVTFPDGKEKEILLYYDSYKEWLQYKDEKGEEKMFHPEDVASFEYLGSRYYSLPFNNGKLSFFRVEYEGAHTALLSKDNSLNLMHHLSTKYDKIYRLCGGSTKVEPMRLCEISYSHGNLNSPLFDRTYEEVALERCLFIVGDQGLKLYQVEVRKSKFLGIIRYTRRTYINSLEDLLGRTDYQKVRDNARKNRLREDRLEDLVRLFSSTEGM